MLLERDITNLFSFKPFICEAYSSEDQGNITLEFESHQNTSSLSCPICNGKVHIHDTYISTLKDIPSLPDGAQKIKVLAHRYATCVMDIDESDVIWVGKGRSVADFSKFFEETDKVWVKKR